MAGVTSDLELTIDSALAQVDALEARLAEVAAVQITVEADTAAAESDLSAISPDPVEVQVEADNAPAVATYRKLGFAVSNVDTAYSPTAD